MLSQNVHGQLYATCLDALALNSDESLTFLNIGSGSGYLSCVAGLIMGKRSIVHSVEVDGDVLEFGRGCVEAFRGEHERSGRAER